MIDHRHAAPSRRAVLAGLAAGASCAVLPCGHAHAQRAAQRSLIDVHHHHFPKAFLEAAGRGSSREPSAFQRNWSPAQSLEVMDKNRIQTAMLSLTFRDVFGESVETGRKVARACNESGATLMHDHPGRFGQFACVPLPDVDGSLQEIAYALDTLKADGILLFTSYGNKWPGDPLFTPVFEELNRRKAVVFFHPLAPSCCEGLMPGINDNFIEYTQDSARAILSLLFNGTFVKFRDIRWLFSHGGGPIPALSGRITTLSASRSANLAKVAPNGIDAELKRLHYDTANTAYSAAMAALLDYIPVSQLLFGTDYPSVSVEENTEGLAKIKLSDSDRAAIERGNALTMFPRLQA